MLKMLAIAISALVLMTACSRSDAGGGTTAPQTPHSTPFVTETPVGPEGGGGPLSLWEAETLDTLVSRYPHVVVARVDGLVAKDPLEDIPPLVENVYQLKVVDTISSASLKEGDTLNFRKATLDPKLAPLPQEGMTYLFFLTDWPGGDFTDAVFARFEVTPDGKIVPNGFESTPGIAAVSGVTAEQVEAAAEEDSEAALEALATRTIDELRPIIKEVASRVTPAPTIEPTYTPVPSAPPPTPTPALTPTPPTAPTSTPRVGVSE